MALRRGFKTEAEEISLEVRRELDLKTVDPLDPRDLARHLGVPILGLRDLAKLGADKDAVRHFLGKGQAELSGFVVFRGSRCAVICNESHARTRQNSSLAHELSHLILGHEPAPALGEGGCRRWDQIQEAEADWLGGTLLVPRVAALKIARSREDLREAAKRFGVSRKLMRWRLNHTGALKQAQRERRLRVPQR